MLYKFPDLWPDSTLGTAVQRQCRSKARGGPACPAHGLLPSRFWQPVLCTASRKKALASLPIMARPCPHHIPAVLFLLLLRIYPWDSSAILIQWTKLLLPPSLRPSEWKPAVRGAGQPGTGVPARAVCSISAALERHEVSTFPLLARCLVAAKETAWPTELSVCCSAWGLQPLPSTPCSHKTQAYQWCLFTGIDFKFNVIFL